MDSLKPIPTPPAQRWREFRIQVLPIATFIVVLACVAMMWKRYVLPTNIVGEVESVRANIISTVPGTILELKVTRFQRVTKGQEIAVISAMSPEAVQASLRAIEGDLKLMRARMQLDIERNTLGYQQARLEYLKERVELNMERVNARYYESEAARLEKLANNNPPLVDMTTYETAVRLAAHSRTNITEREKYLAEKEQILPKLAPAVQADDVILDAIKAQEDALRATDQIISIKSPMDGMVSAVNHLQGEKIAPNLPIVVISAMNSTRIIGYVRKPFSVIPKAGDTVQVRRQSFKREVVDAKVLEVSNQLEPISTNLVPPPTGALAEMGLPFAVSLPSEISFIPGEPVELIFGRK